jgi:predicted Ser/Thr protein kinase
MASLLICPQGHHWPAAPDGSPAAAVCPTCGAAGRPLADAGSAASATVAEQPVEALAGAPTEVKPAGPQEVPAPANDAAPVAPILPGYEVLGELGRGGMGVVYRARQRGLNREVALKVLRAGGDAEPHELARFKAEAEAVARLHHPNIVQIHEIAEHDGRPCLCLELVDGGGLDARLQGQPLPPEQAAELVATLAEAMHAAHQRGIVHRDLKPANILLTADGTPKITDFGLAKRLDRGSQHTQSGSILGTPQYMAPEQAGGSSRNIGPAADIYSLGAILYELLTGRPPFQGEHFLDTLDQVRWQVPVPPRRLQPGVPRDLEAICLKCLEKERTRRYATAADLAEDLGRFLKGERTVARWGRAGPLNQLTAGIAAVLQLLAVVPRILARRWGLTLVCCLLSVFLARWSSSLLVERYGQRTWRISGSLVYAPQGVAVGQRQVLAPQDFATVLSTVKARRNFDDLASEFGLGGMDTNLLANSIFQISPMANAAGEAQNIQVVVEWDDPEEGVQLVSRLMEISQQRQREDRRSILTDLYRRQKDVLDRKQAEVDKGYKDLNEFLTKKGVKDAPELADSPPGLGDLGPPGSLWPPTRAGLLHFRLMRSRSSEEAFQSLAGQVLQDSVTNCMKDVADTRTRIKEVQKKITALKEGKARANDLNKDAVKELEDEIQNSIDEQEGNFLEAREALLDAERDRKEIAGLFAQGTRPKSDVDEAARLRERAREKVQRIEKLIDRLDALKAQFTPDSAALLATQAYLGRLELVELPEAESELEQARKELEAYQRRTRLLREALPEVETQLGTITVAEKERDEQRAVLQEIRNLQDNLIDELRILDPAKAGPPISRGKWIPFAAFAACMALLLPGIIAYDRLRGRSVRRPNSGRAA